MKAKKLHLLGSIILLSCVILLIINSLLIDHYPNLLNYILWGVSLILALIGIFMRHFGRLREHQEEIENILKEQEEIVTTLKEVCRELYTFFQERKINTFSFFDKNKGIEITIPRSRSNDKTYVKDYTIIHERDEFHTLIQLISPNGDTIWSKNFDDDESSLTITQ